MLLSHEAVLHYQRYHLKNPRHSFAVHNRPNVQDQDSVPRHTILPERFPKGLLHSTLCGAAVITRLIGKTVATINACWILAWSLLTYSNVMTTPYCTTAYFSLKNHGWMRLWNFQPETFTTAALQELGSLAFGTIVSFCACVLIHNLTSEQKTNTKRWRATCFLLGGFLAVIGALMYLGAWSIRNLA